MKYTFDDGKYVIERDGYRLTAIRHGEPWTAMTDNLVGNKLVLAMRARIEILEECLEDAERGLRREKARHNA